MTQVLSRSARAGAGSARPARGAPPGRPPARSPAGTGAALCATVGALGLSVTVSVGVLAWAADPRSGASAGQAVRLALDGWLLAQHVELSVPGGAISLPPLAITAALVAMLIWAGGVLGRTCAVSCAADAWRAVASLSLPYAAVSLTVAEFGRTASVAPSVWQAALWPALWAAGAAWLGLYRARGAVVLPRLRWPDWVGPALRAGTAAVALLLAAGVALTVVALVAHTGRVAALAAGLRPGLPGGVLLALLNGALAPNAAVAAAGYAAGPGFAVGIGTRISPLATSVHALPALPLLGAVPGGTGAGWLTMALPVAGGVVAAVVLRRRWPRPATLETVAVAMSTGAVAGILLAGAAAVAGGAGGPGGLRVVGVSPWQVGLAAAAEVGLAAAAAIAAPSLADVRRFAAAAGSRLGAARRGRGRTGQNR